MYVIKRIDQGGGYLGNDPGRTGATWVKNVDNARTFYTEEAARQECCPENEVPVSLDSI